MPRRTTNLTTWEPSPEQVYAAQLLARCYTWQQTADEVGIKSLQTIANWLNIPGFRAMVDANVQKVAEALDAQLVEGAQEMMLVWRQMVRGEVQADDKRLDRIAPIVREYFLASVKFDDAGREPQKGAPGMAVQFNIGSPGNSGGGER